MLSQFMGPFSFSFSVFLSGVCQARAISEKSARVVCVKSAGVISGIYFISGFNQMG